MKSRFLDIKNCYNLLPKGNGLPILARLDECLTGINNGSGPLKGSIETLIGRNERTINQLSSRKRLINSPIEIAQETNLETRVVHTQAVERHFPGTAKLHTVIGYENGMEHKTVIPLQFLLKGWGDANIGYQGYIHTISLNVRNIKTYEELMKRQFSDDDTFYYVGITGRNWLQRFDEHVREMRKGNRRLFYQAWREKYGTSDVTFDSTLSEVNMTYKDAMDWEELKVDKIASDKYGLNMIPGGFKGLNFLHKLRVIKNINISLDERDKAIADYLMKNPRKGIPNPIISDLWKNDEYYLKVIEARPKTLSPSQVRKIRELEKRGYSLGDITDEVEALNITQVKNVILGKTYIRID